jgi:3-deoxy-D-manno-octulosonic-acid transferase
MIWIYRLLFPLLLLVLLPKQIARMRKRGGYERDWQQRFGTLGTLPTKQGKRVWLQAVSVGELNAIGPLLSQLQQAGIEIALSTTTSTGYALAQQKYADQCVAVFQFPLDWWPFSARAWAAVQPDLVVQMESELWPEHLHRARSRGVPVILANARLSDRSFANYQKHRWLARWLLGTLDCALASSSEAAQRLQALGLPESRIELTGNIKVDVKLEPPMDDIGRISLLCTMGFTDLSPTPFVLMGSSTWPGEEAMLLETLQQLRAGHTDARLLIVPRHAERKNEIQALMKEKAEPGTYHFRSDKQQAPPGTIIYIGDTTGELKQLSQAATLVFIGKSLPPNDGGQTPIEVAALGLPMLYGPAMSNFRDVCRELEARGGAARYPDANSCQAAIISLAEDSKRREEMADAAKAWHADSQGATQAVCRKIQSLLQ